jgi:hypothetical protein
MKTFIKTLIGLTVIFSTAFTFSFAQGEWTILESYEIPGKASGLAWDGTYLYFGIYGVNGDNFYRFDPQTGESTLLFTHAVVDDSFGMTWDGEHLWVIFQPSGSSNPAEATQIDLSGNTVSSFPLPDHYMSGIAYDDGNFFACTYFPNPGIVYYTDDQGTPLSQFAPPAYEQIWDVAIQDDFLWFVDYDADMIYKTDRDGTLIEEHQTENMKPSGIVWDGVNIWYVDGQLSNPSTLYKVDPGGTGTPVINIPFDSWNFGIVTIGDSAVWNIEVGNAGTADLTIENLSFPGAVPLFSWEAFPQTIPPGEFEEIELIYKPIETGNLDTFVLLLSDDPITPEYELTVAGEAVNAGPSIHIANTQHDYGDVRAGALTRWQLFIENLGDEILIIESLTSNSESFIVDEDILFPVNISTLGAENLGIWFNPTAAGNYSGSAIVASNDPQNPTVEIVLSGNAFEQEYNMGEMFWQYIIDVSYDNSPKAIASIKDINGDGINDIIVASEDNYVRCFNGNSHETADIFWEFEIYSGNVYLKQALGFLPDLNGDGHDEVVVGTTGGDRSVVVLSGKTGEQLWKFETGYWGDGGWVYQVDASTDFNSDGFPDVLACAGNDSQGTGPLRAFCLDGMDGSLIWDYYIGGPGFSVIAINDVTGDGIPDALAGGSNAGEQQGKIICINGNTGFEIWTKVTEGSSVWALLQIDDINSDGIADVVAGEFGSGKYQALDATNGDLLFTGSVGSGFSIITNLIKLDDVNGDGYADFTLTSNNSSCIAIDGVTGENIWFTSLDDQAQSVARIPDISGDGINDVIVGTLYQNNYVYYLDGVFGDILFYAEYPEPIDALGTTPDINGDGSWEVVAGGRGGLVTCLSGGTDAMTFLPENSYKQKISTITIAPNPALGNIPITITLSGEISGNLQITTAGGVPVKDFGFVVSDQKQQVFQWNGRSSDNRLLTRGLYFVVVSNENTTHSSILILQ